MSSQKRFDIIEAILDVLKTSSSDPAFFINGTTYSYKELGEQVAAIYKRIITLDQPNIGIVAQDSIETYAAILAVLFGGKGYVILHPSFPEDRNLKIAAVAQLKTVLCNSSTDSVKYLSDKNLDLIDLELIGLSDVKDIVINGGPNDNAYIIFTSGSTGEPKGVPISRENLNAFYSAYSNIGLKFDKSDKMLQMFELTFDVSVVSTLVPLSVGACVYTIGSQDVKYLKIFELLEEHSLTFAAVAPSVLNLISPYLDQISLPALRYLVVTAEASQVELLERFSAVIPNATIYNLYGPTEGTIYCTYYRVEEIKKCKQHNGMLAIGRPFDGIDAVIVDENGAVLPDGQMGEMWIAGPQVMAGYLNNEQQTIAAFATNDKGQKYYKTGDLCVRDGQGELIYCGRKDYQVKVQGFRIELSEIEYSAKQFFGNQVNVVVAPLINQGVCTELHMAVEIEHCDQVLLLEHLANNLPYYMIPKKIHTISPFPLSSSNKVDRKQILSLIQSKL